MPANTFDFSGKVALIIGGSRGIGRVTALLFGKSGAKVVIGDVNPAGIQTVEAVKREGGDAVFVKTDVRAEEAVTNLMATAVETYGALHCAFNNAGILPPTATLRQSHQRSWKSWLSI